MPGLDGDDDDGCLTCHSQRATGCCCLHQSWRVASRHPSDPPHCNPIVRNDLLKSSLQGSRTSSLCVIDNSGLLRRELKAGSEMLAVAMKTEQRLPGYFTLHNNMRAPYQICLHLFITALHHYCITSYGYYDQFSILFLLFNLIY